MYYHVEANCMFMKLIVQNWACHNPYKHTRCEKAEPISIFLKRSIAYMLFIWIIATIFFPHPCFFLSERNNS